MFMKGAPGVGTTACEVKDPLFPPLAFLPLTLSLAKMLAISAKHSSLLFCDIMYLLSFLLTCPNMLLFGEARSFQVMT